MKRLALAAAIFAVTACSKADNTPADTTTPAMAPAPTAMDTGMKMDTAQHRMMMDSMKADSAKMKMGTKTKTKTKTKR